MIVTSLYYDIISLCKNVISYVKHQMRYPGQSLTAGGVAEHHCYPDVDQPTALLHQSHLGLFGSITVAIPLLTCCRNLKETIMSYCASLSASTWIGRNLEGEARSLIALFAGKACRFHHHQIRVLVNLTVAQAE
jgi:hypothetical protein